MNNTRPPGRSQAPGKGKIMSYNKSTYDGDDTYSIDCTGDCVTGDEVRFDRATFTGSHRRPKFAGFERVTGRIVRDSYGAQKQQHTFTLRLADGSETRIKGRNLYRQGTHRKPWSDESARQIEADKKHRRGDAARKQREIRREIGV